MKKQIRKTENLIKTKGEKKNKERSSIDFKKYNKYFIAILVIIALVLSFFVLKKLRIVKPVIVDTPETELEKYEYYIGPEDFSDRGMWVDVNEYYKLFLDDHREANLYDALFKASDFKGIFPQGVNLTPIMISYDSCDPYDGNMSFEKLEEYKAISDNNEFEVQLGVSADCNISNSYEIYKDGIKYIGNANAGLSNIEYYLVDNFDPSLDNETLSSYVGNQNFITPYFSFRYMGNASSTKYDESGNVLENIYVNFDGSLVDGDWNYTCDIVSSGYSVFKNGSSYIRCKLPCKVTKEIDGTVETYDSTCNIYFVINSVRLGSWFDCMPDTSGYVEERVVYADPIETDNNE